MTTKAELEKLVDELKLTITVLKAEATINRQANEALRSINKGISEATLNLHKELSEAHATIQSLKDERDSAIKAMDHHINCDMRTQEKIQSLKDEIEVLRRYGNKDCTAMADEAITQKAEELDKCPPHSWDASGERCTKCGDKDWMT